MPHETELIATIVMSLVVAFAGGFALLAYLLFRHAIGRRSLYVVVVTGLYSYVMAGGMVVRVLTATDGGAIYLVFLYFIGSAVALVAGFMEVNKRFKHHDRV